jgi:hypothetical protein
MSRNLSALPFNFDEVLESFSVPGQVQAYERVTTQGADGMATYTASLPRPIDAVVLTMSLQELQILTEGDVSGGGIVLQTKETLYWQTSNTAGTETRQSFVLYNGFTWRVMGSGLTAPNSSFHNYPCTRYLSNDNSGK